MADLPNLSAEWLEPDGLGGFASGTVSGERTRRYHAVLLTSNHPPSDRFVLVNGFDAWLETSSGSFAISTQRYPPDVVSPDGFRRLTAFTMQPWPTWTFTLENGTCVQQELFAAHGTRTVCLRWRIVSGQQQGTLSVRPFFSGRDTHSLHQQNSAFNFEPVQIADGLIWHPYDGVPSVRVRANAQFQFEPQWYQQFFYTQELERGLDCLEDLAAPGVFRWDLAEGDAVLILEGVPERTSLAETNQSPQELCAALAEKEHQRRALFASPLDRAADAYLVARDQGRTILAGYPWFMDWGRDTFISLRGLCLATGRLEDAQRILLDWSEYVSEGMLPNRFPDHGHEPEYNSVDAALWYIIATHDFFEAVDRTDTALRQPVRRLLEQAVQNILEGYRRGTRFGIHCDLDGLIAAGQEGLQLTWMDAKVNGWVVTPRIGKPVEIQALWINALRIASRWDSQWNELAKKAQQSFEARFWNEEEQCLYDVVDANFVAGAVDASLRPNQIFAIGGLPWPVVNGERAKKIVDTVQKWLWTPMGLRTLAPDEPGYIGRYEGSLLERDASYHQGTAWPWLLGPFVEAWVRVRDNTDEARHAARRQFIEPLLANLRVAGLDHIAEIADGDPPHHARGCRWQAWSMGELLRLLHVVLRPTDSAPPKLLEPKPAEPKPVKSPPTKAPAAKSQNKPATDSRAKPKRASGKTRRS